ncbi:alkaline shock response membrane anchor protein AmaP [Amycolatopsis antarctica]|uniref:Alkaline shock response membrane anchor protein AmaP n=1 Tax=Amycolatopsis antarctica TaxID=1854586 RepID=A0A263D0L2_9PSEU|nr:alkaline shock response membrane anchor protein AmaP [Amycolatopsis antarctica]OZM71066.1 alkaline shock response membrane anchor protein AmaP [Amycolatopsis antarctica]
MSKSVSTKALARSYGAERGLTSVIGLLALAGGVAALVVGLGWLGDFRARRPVLDPLAVEWLGGHAVPAKIVAIVLGVLLFVFGLWWFFRSLRPEGRPDIELDREVGKELTVTSGAISSAVQADAESVEGVAKARARAVGDTTNPALRLTLWLREGTDLKAVWEELDARVLSRARESLGVEVLPTAVRIELDSGERQRVR